ncbi:MAG: hypothetical protein GY856_42100 [bacterium]|nr:hypothetical protein [bacterium]
MDKDLIAYLDRRFDETGHQIESLRREMVERLDQGDERFERIDERFERVETDIRHTHVLLEDLRSDLQGVAEGVIAGREALERFRKEVDRRFTKQESNLRPYFAHLKRRDDELDTRLRKVESAVA